MSLCTKTRVTLDVFGIPSVKYGTRYLAPPPSVLHEIIQGIYKCNSLYCLQIKRYEGIFFFSVCRARTGLACVRP